MSAVIALICATPSAAARDDLFRPRSTTSIVAARADAGLLELFADDDEGDYSHDRHYDFDQYRNATSRKERIRDYYRMQKDMQKDYWKGQKEMQKNAIKRQRGW